MARASFWPSRPRDDGTDCISDAPHLTLDPFQRSETDLAVRRWLPQADPFLIARIHNYAGGVPLFIEELCHSVSAGNPDLWEGRGTQGWVGTLVASRLARLPPEQVNVVRAAAVIGSASPSGCWFRPATARRTRRQRERWRTQIFFMRTPAGAGFRFKHGITRDAVYDFIGLRERQALHERIEAALLVRSEQTDREDTLEALAYHSRGARHWESAAHYAERAGDKAMAAFALDRAREQYLVAMETLDHVSNRTREQSLRWCLLANKLGMASIFDPLALSDEVTIFEQAVARAHSLGDANALARAHYWLGYMCYGFGRFREARITRGWRWRWRASWATRAWRLRSKLPLVRSSPRPVNTIRRLPCWITPSPSSSSGAGRAAAWPSARLTHFHARRAYSPIAASLTTRMSALRRR